MPRRPQNVAYTKFIDKNRPTDPEAHEFLTSFHRHRGTKVLYLTKYMRLSEDCTNQQI
jgi:hypothetical protein